MLDRGVRAWILAFPCERNVQPVRPGERSREEEARDLFETLIEARWPNNCRSYEFAISRVPTVRVDLREQFTFLFRVRVRDCMIDGFSEEGESVRGLINSQKFRIAAAY